jgi:hypothetical protein
MKNSIRVSLAAPFHRSMERFHVPSTMLKEVKEFVWQYHDVGTTITVGEGQTLKYLSWNGFSIHYAVKLATGAVELIELKLETPPPPPPPPKGGRAMAQRPSPRSGGWTKLASATIRLLSRWLTWHGNLTGQAPNRDGGGNRAVWHSAASDRGLIGQLYLGFSAIRTNSLERFELFDICRFKPTHRSLRIKSVLVWPDSLQIEGRTSLCYYGTARRSDLIQQNERSLPTSAISNFSDCGGLAACFHLETIRVVETRLDRLNVLANVCLQLVIKLFGISERRDQVALASWVDICPLSLLRSRLPVNKPIVA